MDDNLVSLGTHLKVADVEKSREFYEGFGFKPVFGYGDDEFRANLEKLGVSTAPEKYRGVVYEIGDAKIPFEIADGHIAVKDKACFKEVIKSPKVSAMVKVKSLIPILEKGVELSFPIRKYYWGSIELALRDPDGFVLVFIAPYSEEEMRAVGKFVEVEVINP
jgi:catechol 2,3-dioxygenase-like lactoylglutathione lyase family enzyme